MAGKALVSTTCISQSMAMDINKLQQIFCSNKAKFMEAIDHYNTLKRELKYMKENIIPLLQDLEEAKDKVDKVHKGANVTIIASSATSIVGGALFLGGIIAAPFTLGATLGLTIAGGIVSAGSATANLSALIADTGYGEYKKRKTEEKINEFLSHYDKAEAAYFNLLGICNTLCSLTSPESKAEEKRGFVDKTLEMGCLIIEYAWKYKSEAAALAVTVKSVGSLGWNSYKAVTKPRVLQEDLNVLKQSQALMETKFMPKLLYILRRPLTKNVIRKAGSFILRSSGPLMKLGAGLFTLIGIGADIFTICTTGYDMYKNKKTEVSENLSKHIENLKIMQQKLYVLNEQIELIDSKITSASYIAS